MERIRISPKPKNSKADDIPRKISAAKLLGGMTVSAGTQNQQ
jgi:hypothetical protein